MIPFIDIINTDDKMKNKKIPHCLNNFKLE